MPRRLFAAAATGALLLGLAACGDGGDGPVTTPPPDISIDVPSDGGGSEPSDGGGSETAEPTVAAPDIPPPDPADYAGMDEHTPEGAEQAFRYYIAMVYWGYQTGSGEITKGLYGPTCSECDEFTKAINDIGESGRYWSSTTISDYGTDLYESENYGLEIGYIYIVAEHEEPSGNTGAASTVPEQAYTAIGGMDWIDGGWSVGGIEIKETESEL